MNSKRLVLTWIVLIAAALACGQANPAAGPTPTLKIQNSAEAEQATAAQQATQDNVRSTSESHAGSKPILIGTEYIIIDIPVRVRQLVNMLAPLGLTAAKPLPENFAWGKMQKSPDAAIDFSRLDTFVSEFQTAGIKDAVLALRPLADWANKDIKLSSSFFPYKGGIKEEYLDEYEYWVGSVVERYDMDGNQDMPGLRYPVRYYEIGTEFSTYEPESVDEYLDILGRAYRVAHAAYSDVLIAHVAFLPTPALFKVLPNPSDYDVAFNANLVDKTHPLSDMRKILDHPEIFDLLNFHSLGHPYEIEAVMDWLDYETSQRGYTKPVIISDTASTPFIAWGAAARCGLQPKQMGRVVPPATDADRCRLADYFTNLLNKTDDTLAWTQDFIAEDTVKRVVVAAEQGITLIDTAFTEDLLLLKLGIAQASAGTSAWAGLVDFDRKEYRPVYYALQQLIRNLGDYESIVRLDTGDDGVRVYEITRAGSKFWIAWYDPRLLTLPGEAVPEKTVQMNFGLDSVLIQGLATSSSLPVQQQTLSADNGSVSLTLTPSPVFIFSAP